MGDEQEASSSSLDITPPTLDLNQQLKALFGFETFQPGQRSVIESTLTGAPTLAVMPTGAGKSLCYQLPAATLDGVTLVVSPLISLMKDQVDGLIERGISAAFLNSTLTPLDQREVIYQMERGAYKLVYIAPERFQHGQFISALQRINISLIAVDEAHCISRWGHNFRPHYARLGEYLNELDPPRVLACTATATPRVCADIIQTLRFKNPRAHVAGFLRENLYLEARLCNSERSRQSQLEDFLSLTLEEHDGAVVIYSTTVKRVEKYAQVCVELIGAEQVVMYHGRLPNKDRQRAQERFMSGDARVVVATNAFGMGVDRSDVRAVVHIDMPGTLEGYYQEVGRAGRDRDPAHCLLLYMQSDLKTHEFLISRSNPSTQHIQAVWNALCEHTINHPDSPLTAAQLTEQFKRGSEPVDAPLRHFKSAQLIRVDQWSQGIEVNPQCLGISDVYQLPLDLTTLEQQREHELQNLEKMRDFAQSPLCRHTYLLQYFGEGADGGCPKDARCDRCLPSPAAYRSATQATGALTEDERRITIKALSGVARAKGIYGKTRVIEMISGASNARIDATFLKNLSTYGILRHLGPDACKDLINSLIGGGLCMMAPRILPSGEVAQYKSLQLTPEGFKVMSGKADPAFRLEKRWVQLELRSRGGAGLTTTQARGALNSTLSPKDTTKASPKPKKRSSKALGSTSRRDAQTEETGGLREALRRYRLAQAREREIPPFAVFSDAVLGALVADTPKDQHGFLAIRGLGPAKWAQYGIDILRIIQEHQT